MAACTSHSCGAVWSRESGRECGIALLAMVIVLGLFGVLATVSHLVGMDRVHEARAFRESSAALLAAEAGVATALALWDTASLQTLPPGATLVLLTGKLHSGDGYEVSITRLDDGSGSVRYYRLESTGRSHGAWRGRRSLAAFVKNGADARWRGELEESGDHTSMVLGEAEGGSSGAAAELYLPHPLAQFAWLEILE